ncbi:dimethylaniline monooxygenase [N-oxide-forming] [Elysia marginata]|uniref:Flavin-containing monooxygenase n=1 Tax=Elysia marginata TaxID=1093978 RepID=A0AAV4EKN5_9GAST|nr:dimethylaniline monooxygenase [N-oxide-forming] [Elysia marginata]
MWEDVKCQDAINASNLIPSQHYSSLVKYLPYMDELAKLIGCYPDFRTLLRTDPVFAFKLWAGPVYPYSYRLFGPGQWTGARDAILTAMDRVRTPFQTRPLSVALGNKTSQCPRYNHIAYAVILLLVILTAVILR